MKGLSYRFEFLFCLFCVHLLKTDHQPLSLRNILDKIILS